MDLVELIRNNDFDKQTSKQKRELSDSSQLQKKNSEAKKKMIKSRLMQQFRGVIQVYEG